MKHLFNHKFNFYYFTFFYFLKLLDDEEEEEEKVNEGYSAEPLLVTSTYNAVLKHLGDMREYEKSWEIFQEMGTRVKYDTTSYNNMIKNLFENDRDQIAEGK